MSLEAGFRKVLYRELGHMRRKRSYTVFVLVLPLVAFLFFSLLMYEGMPTKLPIAVYDQDKTSLSRQVIQMMDASSLISVDYRVDSEQEAKELMMRDRIVAFVMIPQRMESKVYRNEEVTVVGYVNTTNVLKGSLVYKDLRTVMQTFSTGVQLQVLMQQGMSGAQAYSTALPVFFQEHTLFNPYLNYSYFLLPGFFPMMLLIFILITTTFVIGGELKYGTAREWVESAGGSIRTALVGKLFPYFCIFLVQCFLMNVILFRFLGVPFAGNLGLWILTNLVLIFAYMGIGILFVSLFKSMRLSMSIGGGYSVLAFSYSGLTFPFLAMEPAVAFFGKLFPFTYYMEIFIDQAMRGAPVYISLGHLGYLCIFALLPLLVLRRLKRLCYDPTQWGKL